VTNINPFINLQAGQAASNAKSVSGLSGTQNQGVGQTGDLSSPDNLNSFLQNLLSQVQQANNAGQVTLPQGLSLPEGVPLPEGISIADLTQTLQQLIQGTVPAGTANGTQLGQNDPAQLPVSSILEGLQPLLTNETNTALITQGDAGPQTDLTSPPLNALLSGTGTTILKQVKAEIKELLKEYGTPQPQPITPPAVTSNAALVNAAVPALENAAAPILTGVATNNAVQVNNASPKNKSAVLNGETTNTPPSNLEAASLEKTNEAIVQELTNKIVQTLQEQGVNSADIDAQIETITTLVQNELQQSSQTSDIGALSTPLSVLPNASQPVPTNTAPVAKTTSESTHPTRTEPSNATGVSPNLSASNDIESEIDAPRTNPATQQNTQNSQNNQGQSTASQQAASLAGMQQNASPQAQQVINSLSQKVSGLASSQAPSVVASLLNSDTAGFDMSQNGGSFSGDTFTNELNAPAAGQLKTSIEGTQNNSFANYVYNSGKSAPVKTLQMLSVQIQKGVEAQMENIRIQLQPLNLGSVDIEMSFGEDGSVKANLVVEKPETLALLQKDASSLEESLKQAGLDLDHDSLSFDLKQSDQDNNQHADNNGYSNKINNDLDANAAKISAQLAIEAEQYVTETGVNLWV